VNGKRTGTDQPNHCAMDDDFEHTLFTERLRFCDVSLHNVKYMSNTLELFFIRLSASSSSASNH